MLTIQMNLNQNYVVMVLYYQKTIKQSLKQKIMNIEVLMVKK